MRFRGYGGHLSDSGRLVPACLANKRGGVVRFVMQTGEPLCQDVLAQEDLEKAKLRKSLVKRYVLGGETCFRLSFRSAAAKALRSSEGSTSKPCLRQLGLHRWWVWAWGLGLGRSYWIA